MVNYTSGLLWMASWPVLIYVSYKFIMLNIEHFEEYIKER